MNSVKVLASILFSGSKVQGECIDGGDHLVYSLDHATDDLETTGSFCEICKSKVILADAVPIIQSSTIICVVHKIEVLTSLKNSIPSGTALLRFIYSDRACDKSPDGEHLLEGLASNWRETDNIGHNARCAHCYRRAYSVSQLEKPAKHEKCANCSSASGGCKHKQYEMGPHASCEPFPRENVSISDD